MPVWYCFPLLLLIRFSGAEMFTIGYLTNMHGRENPKRQGLVISGAISYALDVVNSNASLLGGHQLHMIYNDTEGDTLVGTNVIIQQWRRGAIAFFGPEDSCEVEATVAASLNLPMISYKCADTRVSDKGFYRTFARTNPSDKGVVRSILVLLRYYRWRKFSIISEASNPYMTVAKSLEQQAGDAFLVNRGRGVTYFANMLVCCEDGLPCCGDPFARVVEDTYKYTRVYVFFGSRLDLIHFSIMLQMRKLLDSGEYVILYIDLEAYSEHESYKYFWRMDMRPHHVFLAMRAARSLLVIVPSPPIDKGYRDFEDKVRDYNMQEPFCFPNSLPYAKHITEFAAYLYDAVLLYAEALSAALADGEDPRNGTAIIRRIISREIYQSVTGAVLHMDENGDVEGNYTVLSLQPAPRTLVLNGFRGKRNLSHLMLPMATFQYETHEPILTLLDVETGWVAPLDEPPCGFDGSGCLDPPSLIREIVSGLLLFTLFILCIICWIMYKKWKYEQEIAGLLWRIPVQDIQRCGSGGGILSPSSSKLSVASQESSRVATFTQTALFKGTLVATKTFRFKSRNVDIQRETKKEMKTMRELHHDNINPFIGACVQPHYILLVTEYCAKGSLKDILENSDIKLDHVFIASLVFDLIKGMIFLHDSDLRVHGNLKSSNCVVTSRWVLRVTDFGLQELCAAAAEDDIYLDYEHYRKLLWRAPELLRNPSLHPRGTQKGDVYSFAIVLHEIVLRKGPFGSPHGLPPEDIVFRVREGPLMGGKAFRPRLEESALQDYVLQTMSECWSEAPDVRPEFRHIKERLKKMKDGITSSNIVDNMMAMMERYADNLEQLVEERTSQLAEEQSKTEALLHRMLPRSVAEQLVRGEAVIPESFDAVTIYFSDIVGFTEMSAESTPMEVVTFLNDLYTVFDSIIGHYDVYKVETIGDAYMVVSGLPIRNGQQHAAEVASMALDLLEAVVSFRIPHRPRHSLRLRVGIHSGPVVAGVVGVTMPRYCLFGDTVNTASRMESSGEPLKIHISEQCNEVLGRVGGYRTEPRGLVKMKGKGEMRTYWLLGHDRIASECRLLHRPPPPLFSIRETQSWMSPKTEFPVHLTPYFKQLADSNPPLVNAMVGRRRRTLRPNPSKEGWKTTGYEGSVPDSLENPDEGFDGRSQSVSRKSSNNSKATRVADATSLEDEALRPLICGSDDLRSMKQSWKRSWSADAINLPRLTLKDWFANVFGDHKDAALCTVGEKAEESVV